MLKTKNEFLEHFARLGVFSKVQALMNDGNESENSCDSVIKSTSTNEATSSLNDAIQQQASSSTSEPKSKYKLTFLRATKINDVLILPIIAGANVATNDGQEDAKEILQGKAYHWHEWSVCRGRDCLYVWSDSAALELSNGSNGWFRFILDGKLATMYSSGSPENGNDNSGILAMHKMNGIKCGKKEIWCR